MLCIDVQQQHSGSSNDVLDLLLRTAWWIIIRTSLVKKALRETQTLRAGCSKAEPKLFAPPQTSFPGAQDRQHLISLRWSLPLPTNPVWRWLMYAISNYRGNRPTKTHTPTNTQTNPQTGPITIHCPAASAQCKIYFGWKLIVVGPNTSGQLLFIKIAGFVVTSRTL